MLAQTKLPACTISQSSALLAWSAESSPVVGAAACAGVKSVAANRKVIGMKCPVERECRRRSSLHEKLFGQLGHRKAPRSRLARSCSLTILSPVSDSEHNGHITSADAEIRERLPYVTTKTVGVSICAMGATLSVVSKHPKDAHSLTLTN